MRGRASTTDSKPDPETGVAPGFTRCRNMRSRCRCSMCPAIHINSRSWLRSSSTHEPSDPPLRVVSHHMNTATIYLHLPEGTGSRRRDESLPPFNHRNGNVKNKCRPGRPVRPLKDRLFKPLRRCFPDHGGGPCSGQVPSDDTNRNRDARRDTRSVTSTRPDRSWRRRALLGPGGSQIPPPAAERPGADTHETLLRPMSVLRSSSTREVSLMILPQVHLRKPCYDFYFL